MIDHSNDGFEVIDPETGRFIDVNERACRAHGYTRAEYLELRVSDIDPIVGRRPWPEVRDATRSAGTSVFESQHRRKDGSVFPVEVNVTVVRREREYFLAVVRDISDRKRAEQELQRTEAQLHHAQKLEAVGRLAGGVAHDFNNLLTVINGDADIVLAELPSDHPMREIVEEIREAGRRGAALTHQLLAFSRKQVLEPCVVEVDTFLAEIRHLLRRVIGEDIDVGLVQGTGGASVKVDPGRFEQAVLNLAVNARDSMPRGGRLTLETACDGDDWVVVRVSDSGHGMDAATQARIFEPFFTTKEPGRGTGLGLSMVHGFVEQSGGGIAVESEVGKGTTFVIRLPRAAGTTALDRRRISDVPASGTETVLLVEDEDNVRTLSKRILQAQGYTVLDARDGDDAMSLARNFEAPIDILVTDVVMPRMGGLDVAAVLGRDRPGMRVLLMSGYSDRAGGVGETTAFLQKPFRPKDLARKVRDVLDDAAPR